MPSPEDLYLIVDPSTEGSTLFWSKKTGRWGQSESATVFNAADKKAMEGMPFAGVWMRLPYCLRLKTEGEK